MDDALSRTVSLFHREVLLFKLIDLPLEVEVFLFLHDLSLLRSSIILGKEALGFVVNEVTEHLERVFLLNFFTFEKLSDLGNSLSEVLHLHVLIL